ncbi:MAG: hypothetical protein WCX69_00510 [Candidatus Paceibacterota bacterium]
MKNKDHDKINKEFVKGRYSNAEKFFIRILISIRCIYSIFRYNQAYIFDANMIISNKKLDKRYLKLLTINNNYWATETTIKEANNLIFNKKFKLINGHKIKKLSFAKLREYYPNTCPLYYNYISAMHNPAIVFDENFGLELITKSFIKKRNLTKNEEKLINKITSQLDRKSGGKDKIITVLRNANISNLRKKRKALKNNDANYLNDKKSLALSLLYCLQRKINVTFVTSDSDFLTLIFDIFSLVLQQANFSTQVLPMLNDNIKNDLLKNKSHTFFLNLIDFLKLKENLTIDAFSDNYKKDFITFEIKYWCIETQKYISLYFRFDETMRQIFLNAHGNLLCPCVKNCDNGNWISYIWWPPSSINDKNTLKVLIRAKDIVEKDTIVRDNIHSLHCKYVKEEISGNINFLSHFF